MQSMKDVVNAVHFIIFQSPSYLMLIQRPVHFGLVLTRSAGLIPATLMRNSENFTSDANNSPEIANYFADG